MDPDTRSPARSLSSGDDADRAYALWRSERLREFDEDYAAWRATGANSFPPDFDTWRQARRELLIEQATAGQPMLPDDDPAPPSAL